MEAFLNIGFFVVIIIFLNIAGLAHYHWRRFAQPGIKAKLVSYTLEVLLFVFLGLAILFFYFY